MRLIFVDRIILWNRPDQDPGMLRVEPNVYSTPDTMDFKELSRTKLFELP